MAVGNPNYDAILSTTFANYRDKFVDNLSNSFFLMYWLTTNGRKVMEDGGESIVVQLMYGKNTTVRSYSGYDILDTTPQEGLTSANYPWKQISGSVSISRLEERKNSGEHKIISLLDSKIKQTEITMRDETNRMFYADGTGNDSKDFFGLDLIVESGTGGWGTLAGIDRSDALNAWWRPQYLNYAGSLGVAAGYTALRNLYSYASRGNEHPDLILTYREGYNAFEGYLTPQQRFDDARMANAGFEYLKFKGAIMGFDEQCINGSLFMLNSNYLDFRVDTQTDFITTEFVRPPDQDAKVAQILAMGNLVASNCARQGRMDGITD